MLIIWISYFVCLQCLILHFSQYFGIKAACSSAKIQCLFIGFTDLICLLHRLCSCVFIQIRLLERRKAKWLQINWPYLLDCCFFKRLDQIHFYIFIINRFVLMMKSSLTIQVVQWWNISFSKSDSFHLTPGKLLCNFMQKHGASTCAVLYDVIEQIPLW